MKGWKVLEAPSLASPIGVLSYFSDLVIQL